METVTKIVNKQKLTTQPNPSLLTGTDFRIFEPTPFWPGWKSHKFNGPGLRYEVAVSIQCGHIVWVYGPFPAGAAVDIEIYRSKLKTMLDYGEMVEADGGYEGDFTIRGKHDRIYGPAETLAKKRVLSRHENINSKLKCWGSLRKTFRTTGANMMDRHRMVFNCVATIVQMELNYRPMYHVNYDFTRQNAAV